MTTSKYTPSYSFSGYQNNNPDKPLPAPFLDVELANIAAAIAGLRNSVAVLLSLVGRVDPASLIGGAGLSDANFVTIRQVMSWLASQTTGGQTSLYVVDFAMSADSADAVNIQWRSGATMSPDDALYSFIQSTLGLTPVQMGAAFSAMKMLTP